MQSSQSTLALSAPFPSSAKTESTALRSAAPSVRGPLMSELIASSICAPNAAVAVPTPVSSPSSTNSTGLVLRPPTFRVTAQKPRAVSGLVHGGDSGSGSSTDSRIWLSCSRIWLLRLGWVQNKESGPDTDIGYQPDIKIPRISKFSRI